MVCESCQNKSTYQDFCKFLLNKSPFVCLFDVCIKGRLAPQEDAIRGYVPIALALSSMTLDVCQLLDNSFLKGRSELFKKQGKFGSNKKGVVVVVARVWLNDNSLKIFLIASDLFVVSFGIGVGIN